MRRAHDDDEEPTDPRTKGLMALALVLLLALASSYLVQALRKEGQIEDCLLAQRLNCDALVEAP
ncbi:MAG TPA: hypothetical protein VL993_17215 [Stellaceae bacterium]|nr:hypothetical protein [Stellaceae bacterium]